MNESESRFFSNVLFVLRYGLFQQKLFGNNTFINVKISGNLKHCNDAKHNLYSYSITLNETLQELNQLLQKLRRKQFSIMRLNYGDMV